MADSIFNAFTNRYSVSKTLKFELKPQGRTQEYIEQNQKTSVYIRD